jgi:hypothetical protein
MFIIKTGQKNNQPGIGQLLVICKKAYALCFVPWLIGNGQLLTAFFPSFCNHATSAG